MDKRIGLFVGLTGLFAMGSVGAVDCPGATRVNAGTNDDTGHVFEVYKANGISWEQAQACVDALDTIIIGAPPNETEIEAHLATITSSSENQWVIDALLTPSLTPSVTVLEPLEKSQVWVGGVQDKTLIPTIPAPGVGDGWRWVNSEGPFSGTNNNLAMPGYTNWASNEPNDGDNSENGTEDHLTLGRYYAGNPGVVVENRYVWNDEGAAPTSVGGFIVEYDVPRNAACTPGSADPTQTCQTIDGQTLIFPDSSVTGGKTIQFTAYEFTDPRVNSDGKCTTRTELTLFQDTAAFGSHAQLKIPQYLCGSPKFVVVKVDSSKLPITSGTVFVENKTTPEQSFAGILPGNKYKCWDPILGQDPNLDRYFADPQYQDVVVWQSTDPGKMYAEGALAGQFPAYLANGAATEATNGCGSTVAKVRGASYFVVGMHIDFGPGFEYGINPAQDATNYQKFYELTKYKLSLLQQSVDESRQYGSVQKPDWQAMSSQLKNAIRKFDGGDPVSALQYVNSFLFKVNSSNYSPATGNRAGFNYNGDHLMRGENIRFMLRVKVVPYKPVP